MEQGQSMKDWHSEKKIMIAVITAVLINLIMSVWQMAYVFKTLDTNPPLINRIIKLEYHMSEQGRVNTLILDELRAAKKQRDKFISEQARRTSAISWVEKQMGVQ